MNNCIITSGFAIGLLLILFVSCRKMDSVIEREVEEFEVDDHIIIGQTMKNKIKELPEYYPILDSITYDRAYNYMNRLVSTLKLTSVVKYRDEFVWKITILHDDRVRTAFTLPGGNIYIYTGLLKFLKAEHELMAVLANEIAYADRELAAVAIRQQYGGVFIGDLTLGKENDMLEEMVKQYPGMKFKEDLVSEADAYAIELICPFQYDINGLELFLQRAHQQQIEWIQSKKMVESDLRLEKIANSSRDCGEGGVTNLEQYQRKIKNFLPNN